MSRTWHINHARLHSLFLLLLCVTPSEKPPPRTALRNYTYRKHIRIPQILNTIPEHLYRNRHNIIAYPRPRVPYGSEDANEPPAEFVNRARITNQLETTSLSQMRVDYDKFQEVVDSDAMRDGEVSATVFTHGF